MLLIAFVYARNTNQLLLILAVKIQKVSMLWADWLIFEKCAKSLNIFAGFYDSVLSERIEIIKV